MAINLQKARPSPLKRKSPDYIESGAGGRLGEESSQGFFQGSERENYRSRCLLSGS